MPPFQNSSTGASRIARISSCGVNSSASTSSARAGLRRQLDRLGGARVDAAARAEQAAVVVVPARARQLEQPLALGEARRRIGVRIDEDVAVIEGGDQPDLLRQQHAVAEHVARHVADADHRERLALTVLAQLEEHAA